jgi:CRISPR-associated protein Cmr1
VNITLRTLTPFWTGGIDAGQADRLHETGIIGSLRWWYEAILRGQGVRACDPSRHSCLYDPKSSRSPAEQLCAACQVFGATGYARRFRLDVTSQDAPAWPLREQSLNIRPYGRTRGWYLNPGLVGTETIQLIGADQELNRMLALLRFLERYGSIGAKPQLGHGVFRIEQVKDQSLVDGEKNPLEFSEGYQSVGELPDLRVFTFFKFRINPQSPTWWTQVPGLRELRSRREDWTIVEKQAAQGMVPVSPALKNHIRYGHQWSQSVAVWLFGTMRGNERIRSKISFSWAYRVDAGWEIRGWLYLPQDQTGRIFADYSENTRLLNAVLADPRSWLQALGLQQDYKLQAEVTLEPQPVTWRPKTLEDVQRFLRDALRTRN